MAYIRKRTSKTGETKYKAEIIIKKHGEILHRESKTFDRQKLARDWAMRRELELQEKSVYGQPDYLPIKDIINAYINHFNPEGRSKRFDLEKLKTREIAKIDVHRLTSRDLVKHIQARNTECKPQTAANDLIWLGNILTTMRGLLDFKYDESIFSTAREILRKEHLIAKSDHRERLPTAQELLKLSRILKNTPAYNVWWFALYSARRISEITRIEWDDINHEKRTVVIRNLKDPRKKNVIKLAKIPTNAYRIILRQQKTKTRVFPYNSKTIGKYFTEACKMAGIKDLHFHDSRHAATTWLFNKGLQIQQVQQVTLHSSWSSLKRYSNLNPEDIDI